MQVRLLAASAFALVALSNTLSAGASEEPSPIGEFSVWNVYSAGSGGVRPCFAVTPPKEMTPPGANRNGVFFMITSWPARNVKNQPSVVPGYPYKDMSLATVQIGSDKFDFFTKN